MECLWFKQHKHILGVKEDTCYCHLSNHLMVFEENRSVCKNQTKNYFCNIHDFILFIIWVPLLVMKIQLYSVSYFFKH